ncbi:MAG: hypothetical protein ACI8PP_003107 [Candidatus Pseudothioglobus sp.]|jgi:hypothetical protein
MNIINERGNGKEALTALVETYTQRPGAKYLPRKRHHYYQIIQLGIDNGTMQKARIKVLQRQQGWRALNMSR